MSDLSDTLVAFIDTHHGQWDHHAWTGLLADLHHAGHNTAEADAIGLQLETARLRWWLEHSGVKGLGARRVDAVVDHFGNMWALSHADVDALAALPKLTRPVATALASALPR